MKNSIKMKKITFFLKRRLTRSVSANILACYVRMEGLFYSAESWLLSEAGLCHMDALKLAWRV